MVLVVVLSVVVIWESRRRLLLRSNLVKRLMKLLSKLRLDRREDCRRSCRGGPLAEEASSGVAVAAVLRRIQRRRDEIRRRGRLMSSKRRPPQRLLVITAVLLYRPRFELRGVGVTMSESRRRAGRSWRSADNSRFGERHRGRGARHAREPLSG